MGIKRMGTGDREWEGGTCKAIKLFWGLGKYGRFCDCLFSPSFFACKKLHLNPPKFRSPHFQKSRPQPLFFFSGGAVPVSFPFFPPPLKKKKRDAFAED